MVEAVLHTFVSFLFCECGGKLQRKHDCVSGAENCFLKQFCIRTGVVSAIKLKSQANQILSVCLSGFLLTLKRCQE